MDWYFLAFLSALFSAAAAISQKKILFDVDALEFSFMLSVFNLLFAAIVLFSKDISGITVINLLILYVKTVLGALAFLSVMLAIKNMEISGALPLLVLTPGVVALFAFLFIGEKLNLIEITGMILLLIGTYILEVKKNQSIFEPFTIFAKSKYHKYIIYALLLFAISSVMDKLLLRNYHLKPTVFVGFQQLFLAINFLFFILLKKKNPVLVFKKTNKNILIWIIIVSVLTIGYRYTQIEAVKIAPVSLVLSVKRTSVFFATLFGGKLFAESRLIKKLLATIILLAGAYLIVVN